jgi:DNA-directed RNA polymerase subunit RPC12/RpoP
MQFVKKIEQDKIDVRSRSYFVYKCNICKKEEWFNWTSTFDTKISRKCPNCGVLDDSNDKEFLIKRKHQLEQKIQGLKNDLESCTLELSRTSAKLAVFEPGQPVEV